MIQPCIVIILASGNKRKCLKVRLLILVSVTLTRVSVPLCPSSEMFFPFSLQFKVAITNCFPQMLKTRKRQHINHIESRYKTRSPLFCKRKQNYAIICGYGLNQERSCSVLAVMSRVTEKNETNSDRAIWTRGHDQLMNKYCLTNTILHYMATAQGIAS